MIKLSQQYKPTPCKGCGKPIVFERQPDGRWGRPYEFDVENYVKLEQHDCPNYKPKPKSFDQQQGRIGGVVTDAWSGTNKQGQMFEARVAQDVTRAEGVMNELIAKMLTDISRELKEQKENIFKLFDNQVIQGHNIIELQNMLSVMFIAGKYNEPKPASLEELEEEEIARKEEARKEEIEKDEFKEEYSF